MDVKIKVTQQDKDLIKDAAAQVFEDEAEGDRHNQAEAIMDLLADDLTEYVVDQDMALAMIHYLIDFDFPQEQRVADTVEKLNDFYVQAWVASRNPRS